MSLQYFTTYEPAEHGRPFHFILFDTNSIKKGLKYTMELTNILNDKVNKFFDDIWIDSPSHHKEYIKSKLGIAYNKHSEKYSGALFLGYKVMPSDDKHKIIKYLDIPFCDIIYVKIAYWFVWNCYSLMNPIWMSNVFGISDYSSEWKKYTSTSLDEYFYTMNDNKLQQYINKVNDSRKSYANLNEIFDMKFYL